MIESLIYSYLIGILFNIGIIILTTVIIIVSDKGYNDEEYVDILKKFYLQYIIYKKICEVNNISSEMISRIILLMPFSLFYINSIFYYRIFKYNFKIAIVLQYNDKIKILNQRLEIIK